MLRIVLIGSCILASQSYAMNPGKANDLQAANFTGPLSGDVEDRTEIDLQKILESSHAMVRQAQEVAAALEGKPLTQEQKDLINETCKLNDLIISLGKQALENNSRNS